ncbi:hypothetical protein VTL71DRAFT_13515 [Oculimacula yallundae]|uniref:Uncharacterized protein n=1 Tax=Oculimacula yallundae TaxID=86028 RepID=A0ABR4CN35_9HELO
MVRHRSLSTGSSNGSNSDADANEKPRANKNSNSDSDSGSGSDSESESESDSGSNSDSNSNPDSEPEPVQPSQKRKKLRWLHAGLFKDAKGATRDVWYAFKTTRRGRQKIIYASDWHGTSFGNLNAGRWKIDLITWDKHHADKWARYITSNGTWAYGNVMKGRRHQRATLLRTWLDPNSPDIFAHGKQGNRTLGPPRNVVHFANDFSLGGVAPTASRVPFPPRNRDLDPSECYPNTRIPFSTTGIVVGCYKDSNNDPLIVIADFLTSQMACHPRFKNHRAAQNDQVESAFYECGWRINRRALERANDAMALGTINNAFQSKHWRHNSPLWVDRYKGKKLSRMLKEMRDDMGEHRDTDESESESSDSDGPDPDASPEVDTDADPSPDEVEDDHDLFFGSAAGPSKPPKAPHRKAATKASGSGPGPRSKRSIEQRLFDRLTGANDSSDEDEELFIPDNSKLKGKGLARTKRPLPGGMRSSPLPSADRLKNVKRSFSLDNSKAEGSGSAKKPWTARERFAMDTERAERRLLDLRAMRNNPEQNIKAEEESTKKVAPKKRIAESTSDEDEEEEEEEEEDTIIITKPRFNTTPSKRIKSESPEEPKPAPVVICLDDSDSDFEILEDKSTPVSFKSENRGDQLPETNGDNLSGQNDLHLPTTSSALPTSSN